MNTNLSNNQSTFPSVPHDDGIYSYDNELTFGAIHIVESAEQVIKSYREIEYEKVKDLKAPFKSIEGVPDEVLLKQIKDQAGIIENASQLFFCTTKEEHLAPEDSFNKFAEPVYPNKKDAMLHHIDYCWKVALLNAYRILDLQNDTSIAFPFGWISPEIKFDDERYPTLMASAAYQMGVYYAKALALQKASFAVKGERMTKPNKGNYSPLGKIIYKACAEIENRLKELPSKGTSTLVMKHLEAQKLASTKNNLWIIYTTEEDKIVDSKSLGKYIKRFRDRS